MSASSPVPKDHPLMVAWESYKATEDYANTSRWAAHEYAVDGSLWSAFEHGWLAGGGAAPFGARACQPSRPSGEREAPADLVALVQQIQALHSEYARGAQVKAKDAAFAALLAWRSSPRGERPEIRVGDAVQVPQWLYVRNDDDLQTDWSSALGVLRDGRMIWRRA